MESKLLEVSKRVSRVPWTARRSNQSILKEINPDYSLEGLMLKLQHFGHLIQRANSLEKALMLRKIESRRRRGTTEDEMAGWQAPGSLACCSPLGRKEEDTTEQLNKKV